MGEPQDKVDGAPAERPWEFRLFWVGSALSVLGSKVSSIAFPLLVLAMDGSAFEAGVVGFAGTFPILLFTLHAGALVDRWNRKRVMILCDLARAVLLGSIPLAIWMGHLTLVQMVAVAFLEGTFSIFPALAEPAAVRSIVQSEKLGSALAQVEARERGAGLLGQPLGGFLFGISRAVPFLADAASYLVSLVTLLFIRKEFGGGEQVEERKKLGAEIAEGIAWLWRQHFIRATVFLVAGSNLLFQVITLMLIVKAEAQGASASAIGLMMAGSGMGGLLGTFVAPWFERNVSKKAVVIGVNWVWALLMPLLPLFDHLYVLGALFGMMAFVGPIWNVTISTYQIKSTPEDLLGRVASAAGLVYAGVNPVGSLLGGLLLQAYGARITGFAVGACMVLIALVATLAPSVRKASDPDRRPAEGEAAVAG